MTKTYRSLPPETWDLVRRDFLAGQSAEQVCARYDISDSAFWKRVGEEGWRRRDQPAPQPEPLDEDTILLDDAALIAQAERRMKLAVQRGDAPTAMRWGRVRDMLMRHDGEPARHKAEIAAQHAGQTDENMKFVRRQIKVADEIMALHRRVDAPAEMENVGNVGSNSAAPKLESLLSPAERARLAAKRRKRRR